MVSPEVEIGQASGKGQRARNEDFHGAVLPEGALRRLGTLICVADGIGGCADGRQASEMTVRTMLNDYYSTPMSWSGIRALHRVAESVNGWLYSQGKTREGGLGTTLVATLFRGRTLSCLWAGDSRLYRLRNGTLDLLTEDHVFGAQEFTVLTKAVGMDRHFTPDIREEALAEGDRYLVLTDGAWNRLQGPELVRLAAIGGPQETAEALVDRAHRLGETDNATAAIIDIKSLPAPDVADTIREWGDLPVGIPPTPGQTVDGFRILRRLQVSPMGEVFAAADTVTGQEVVLKFPDPLAAAEPAWMERFAREEWAGLRVSHPNLARVLAQPPGRRTCAYYVQEYLDGLSLKALWEAEGKAAPPPDRVADWLRQAARALTALHRKGLVHRDVKPDNFMLTKDGRLVLVDLGTVRIEGLSSLNPPSDGRRVVGGTPGFMAPELYEGARGDAASDLFALGVMGYLLLTGRFPFGQPESNVRPDFATLVPVRELRPGVPAFLAGAIEQCLARKPDRRPADAMELVAALDPANRGSERGFVPLVKRDPLRFYQAGFWIFLATTLLLLLLRH